MNRPALVYDARAGLWRYLGRFISTAAGNAMALRLVREGRDIPYINPSGARGSVPAAEVVAYPVPRIVHAPPVLPPEPPEEGEPVIEVVPVATDPIGILVEVLDAVSSGGWESRIEPNGSAILTGTGAGYGLLASTLRTLVQSQRILDIFGEVPRMLFKFRCALQEGGVEWIFGSYAIGGGVALMQAIRSLEAWSVRYPDAKVVGLEVWLH